jgi:hypothetical protein
MFLSFLIKGSRVDKLTTAVRTVKILAIRMGILSLDRVIELMSCFPSLEKLYIQVMIRCPLLIFYLLTNLKW